MRCLSLSSLSALLVVKSSSIDARLHEKAKEVVLSEEKEKSQQQKRELLQLLPDSRSIISSSKNKTACELIEEKDIPDECKCTEPGKWGVVIECSKPFISPYFNDTIGMKISIDPCSPKGAGVSLDVTESEHSIDYSIASIKAGEAKNIPIPGLSFIVPTIGNMGIDAAVTVYGTPDKLTLKVGLNACVIIGSSDYNFCASSIPGLSNIMPWYVLSGSYSFGDFCTRKDEEEETENSEDAVTKKTAMEKMSLKYALV